MRVRYFSISAATLMVMAATEFSARADDTTPAAPQTPATTAAPPPTTSDAPPENVPRPSIVPPSADKGTEPAAPQTTDNSTLRRHRHYAHRRHWRDAYWEPFPIYWPHFYHNRVYWNRIPWFYF